MAESNREKNSILGRRSPLTRIRLRCISISTSMINCALFVWTAWHLSCGNVIRMTQTNRLQISVSSSFLVTANMILSLTNPVVMPVWICCLLGPFANADPIHSSSEIYPGIEMNTDVESTSGNISSNKRTRTEPYYQGLRERLPVSVSTLGSNGTNKERELTFNQVVWRAGKRGLGGGIPGAIAGAIQVLVLMWLRTIINYQSRYGTTFSQALRTLLNEGGIPRLYCGVGFALVQAPLARFISTAANDGVDSMLSSFSLTKDWGPSRTTVVASVVVGCWRMLLMPIDTAKTVLQIDSTEGFRSLMRRVRAGKIGVLYSGAIANAVSAILGHYPWFYTYNMLSASPWVQAVIPWKLLRNAGIGVTASVVSDAVVNVFRVIKTTKQSLGSKQSASYSDTVKIILAADGWGGLFGRGLRTRIYANALQSIVFTIVWRGLVDYWKRREASQEASK